MAQDRGSLHGEWSSGWMFVLAAAGSATGLGNIWKFPYMMGMNGGAAFVLVYLVAIAIIGIPVMMAETLIGRRGGMSPINTMGKLAREAGVSQRWKVVGWMGALSGFLILSFYSVIIGWAGYYLYMIPFGGLTESSPEQIQGAFSDLLASPWLILALHTLIMIITMSFVARGVSRGLELANRWMMPIMFLLILVLVGYAFTLSAFGTGLHFMFDFKASELTGEGVLLALGHAFFSLSLGMGAIMAYGAYAPRFVRTADGGKKPVSIARAILLIAALDTVVALLCGLAIFPVVFENGLEPAQGPGLMFITLPMAFAQIPAGIWFGTVFFVLVLFGALTSAMSLGEPPVAYLVERGMSRIKASCVVGFLVWFLGIGTVLSFNHWSEIKFLGRTIFDSLDFFTTVILMPLGGLLIAIFAGWVMKETHVRKELDMKNFKLYLVWRAVTRILSPLAIIAMLVYGFYVNPLNAEQAPAAPDSEPLAEEVMPQGVAQEALPVLPLEQDEILPAEQGVE